MTGNVDVIIAQKQNVLRLPVTAINPRNGRATVQVVGKDDKLEDRQVTTGLKGDDDVEITSGLNEGDRVVVTAGAGGGRPAAG
jgi:multidrug efflux pump subunit AcrA (membrane-fusion protein)